MLLCVLCVLGAAWTRSAGLWQSFSRIHCFSNALPHTSARKPQHMACCSPRLREVPGFNGCALQV